MTQRLYYDDSYTTQFAARIVERTEVGGRPTVVLDRTFFYPSSGGQPNDLGTLNGVDVNDVAIREGDGAILHVLSGPATGEEAEGRIDWPRRFDHMQHHTGQHILTQAFVEVAAANTVSFHLSPNSITIDLDRPPPVQEIVEQVEDLANQIVIENRPVTARVLSEEEARQLGARIRRVPGHLATDGLRVVEVADFDLTACGGTHVARTGEIGMVKVVKVEKHKEGSRVEFVSGGRALRDYRAKNAALQAVASDLTVGFWEVGQAVSRLKDQLQEAQSGLKRATTALLEAEAPTLLASAKARNSARIVSRAFEGRDPGDVRALASRLVQESGTIVLLGAAGEKAQLIFARSADLPYDVSAVLKSALAVLGSDRGGGRPEFAQGGGVPASLEQVQRALAEAEKAIFAG
jgi:alanyl-tRNA synthetase